MRRRASGILLHLTSLPAKFGVGDLGPEAHRFVDLLAASGQSYWQILPLNPTGPAHGDSPYESSSAFAGNSLLISPELMVRDGLLSEDDLPSPARFGEGRVDYAAARALKEDLIQRAHQRFKRGRKKAAFKDFCAAEAHWLDDFALFTVLGAAAKTSSWPEWPLELRDRRRKALAEVRREGLEAYDRVRFGQYLFFKQWFALKDYAHKKGVHLIGDLPIYVTLKSADAWANPGLFKLDGQGRPLARAGVPPDYFSRTGQLWGNPVYRWEAHQDTGYAWWLQRLEHNLRLTDLVRLDHFRGLVAYWEVPAGQKTAVKGRWVAAPGEDFLDAVARRLPRCPLIAEDLGLITPEVRAVMDRFGLPGMRVLLFAFGPDLAVSPHAPHNFAPHCLVYTGTHDNNTVRGWFEEEATPAEKKRLHRYVGRRLSAPAASWEMIRLAMLSVARTVILPMQDVLGLGSKARMNKPAIDEGNWSWRLRPQEMAAFPRQRLWELSALSGRLRPQPRSPIKRP